MKKLLIILLVLVAVIVGAIRFALKRITPVGPVVASFEECVTAGYPILESYPRQCKTTAGQSFTETIASTTPGTATTTIVVEPDVRNVNVASTTVIKSPLVVTGEARGNWFFEASFPVRLLDSHRKVLASVAATTSSNWMTTDYVPFKATLKFAKPTTATGTLVIAKDNPSGLPENDQTYEIPVRFTATTSTIKKK